MTLKCEVKLNDPNGNGVLYAGQIISGAIEITVTDLLKVKGISVHIKGEAHCKWTKETKTAKIYTNSNHTVLYVGAETYLNSKTYVVQKSLHGTNCDLPPGAHIFNFAFQLPHQIPPSVETSLGYIRYQIVITIEQSGKIDKTFPVLFNVLIPLNLNHFDAIARHPVYVEKSFKYYSFFTTTNPLQLRISIPRTGYAIGEVLSINVDADNLSNTDIKYLRFSLLQNVLYHSSVPCRSSHYVVTCKLKQKSDVIRKLKHVNFDQNIAIPYLPVTDDSSQIICISYDLEIVVVSKGWHNDKKMLIPIIIGNVPICSHDETEHVPLINKMM